MKKLALLVVLALSMPCWASWSFTGLSGAQDNVAGAIGMTFDDGQAQAGLSFLSTDTGSEDYRTALGPYASMRIEVPVLSSMFNEDVETFAGGAFLFDTDQHKWMATPFIGVIMLPERKISPVAVYRYQWMDGSMNAPEFEEGSTGFVGLRILID